MIFVKLTRPNRNSVLPVAAGEKVGMGDGKKFSFISCNITQQLIKKQIDTLNSTRKNESKDTVA